MTAADLIAQALEIAKARYSHNCVGEPNVFTETDTLYDVVSQFDSLDMIEFVMDIEDAIDERHRKHVNFDHEYFEDGQIINALVVRMSPITREQFDASVQRIAEALAIKFQ